MKSTPGYSRTRCGLYRVADVGSGSGETAEQLELARTRFAACFCPCSSSSSSSVCARVEDFIAEFEAIHRNSQREYGKPADLATIKVML